MSEYHKLVVMGRPVAKSNMYGIRVVGKRAIMYTKKELEDFELTLGRIASTIIPETLTELQSIFVRYYQYGKRDIDIDNPLKAIFDSLDHSKTIKRGKVELQVCSTGIANDKLFQLVIAERVVAETKEEERIEIMIAPYEGILPFVKLILKEYDKDVSDKED
jgi:Holliday junction resolvase RusA-like endonuclease